jgi:hypothetical protein
MNNEQAKFILRAYRPGGRDAGDATFCAALQQAQVDPALGAWFAREQAFDAAVAAKVRAVAPPAGLREAILTGARMSAPRPGAPVRARWRPVAWLALAAALVALLSLVATRWPGPAGDRPATLTQMERFALNDPYSAHTGPHADKLGAFGAWLQDPAHPLATVADVNLGELTAEHCRAVSVAGHEVFEICFQRAGGSYHLYIARARDFRGSAGAGVPEFLEQGGRSVAAWTSRGLAYVLMTGGGPDALRRIL